MRFTAKSLAKFFEDKYPETKHLGTKITIKKFFEQSFMTSDWHLLKF